MQDERKIGSIELVECLAEDPFGTVFRGLEWTAPRTTREVLVRRYHAAWQDLGLAARQHEILRNLVHLGHLKPFKGCHMSQDGSPQLLWPFASGRNLSQVLRAAEAQGIPFGIDQALFLVWALSHHIRHLHQVQLSPGILTPYRVWIGFDGWVQLLDVPVIEILQELLPAMPEVQKTMQCYLQGAVSKGLNYEAHQLGALLFEMLTHHPLDTERELRAVLEEAQISLPDGSRGPVPEAIRRLLSQLLGLSEPFQTLEELECAMEESVFGGDFDPSTFGLAFLMQTLFRNEITASATTVRERIAGPDRTLPMEPVATASAPGAPARFRRAGLYAAASVLGGAVVLFGGRAFSRTGTVVSVAEKIPALAASPSPLPASAKPPAQLALPSADSTSAAAVGPESPSPRKAAQASPNAASLPPKGQPVRLRVFVDEEGRVRQVNTLSGAEPGSGREQAAYLMAMQKKLAPPLSSGQAGRGWEEITVMVP